MAVGVLRILTLAALAVLFGTAAAQAESSTGLCPDVTGYRVLADACDLATRLGESPALAAPRDADGLVMRFFIARPFRQAAIERVDIRSATEGSVTIRSGGFVTLDKTLPLDAGEIVLIRKAYAQSEFKDMHAQRVCVPDIFILIEAREQDRYRTAMLCGPGDNIPVAKIIDEIVRNKSN
ncbi:MAG TPA: hypothetical protein VHZ78_08980 [Rhizomicrobium sp.]|jgi:hypothetical protein|nr:hypothetical protein [Rhizomicrobium sp.]